MLAPPASNTGLPESLPRCSTRALTLALALGVATATLPGVALAAPPEGEGEGEGEIDMEARAMDAYNGGKAAYEAGEYQEALELFLEAQSLYPSPSFHYNIGTCYEALENWPQAVISYEAYLRSYNTAFGEDPKDKANVENKIDRLEKLQEQEEQEAEAEPEPQVVVQPPPPEQDDEPERKPGRGLIITGGVLAGVGVGVAAVGGAVFGSQAAGYSRQLDDVYSGGNPERLTLDEARAIDDDGRAAELNQVILLSVGGAVALTGVALLAVGVVKKNKAGGAQASVTPTAGPTGAGLVIHGRF